MLQVIQGLTVAKEDVDNLDRNQQEGYDSLAKQCQESQALTFHDVMTKGQSSQTLK
jgi:hypothetical protein